MCLSATQLAVCKPKVSGHHYVRQQPPTAVPAKAKANIANASVQSYSFLCGLTDLPKSGRQMPPCPPGSTSPGHEPFFCTNDGRICLPGCLLFSATICRLARLLTHSQMHNVSSFEFHSELDSWQNRE